MLYNDEEIRVIPVRKSLTRPQLICGCDRVLFLLLMLFCIALIFPGGLGSGNYVNVLIGIVFFLVGVQILAVIAKYDPLSVKFSAELSSIRILTLRRLMFTDLTKNIERSEIVRLFAFSRTSLLFERRFILWLIFQKMTVSLNY